MLDAILSDLLDDHANHISDVVQIEHAQPTVLIEACSMTLVSDKMAVNLKSM